MAHEKIDKTAVLYFGPSLLEQGGIKRVNKNRGASCGACFMYLKDIGACSVVHKDGTKDNTVSAMHGVCGVFGGGVPMTSREHEPMQIYPRSAVGYYEGIGVSTHCGNCTNFERTGEQSLGLCGIVKGPIHEYACCNAWEFSRASIKLERKSAGGLKRLVKIKELQ